MTTQSITTEKDQNTPILLARLSEINRYSRSTVTRSVRHDISQFLLEAEREIDEYDAEISRLKDAILRLEEKRAGLGGSMEKCRSLLSPVHRLPTEILTNVFSELCLCHPRSVLRLSSVCGRWREIVLSTPSLWTTLVVDFRQWERRYPSLTSMVNSFMERSAGRALQVDLTFSANDVEQEDKADFSSAISILAQTSSRWKIASLFNLSPALPCHDWEFSALQTLCITGHEPLPPKVTGLFSNSTSLRTLDIGAALLDHGDNLLDFPWSQIETLSIHDTSSSRAFEFLAHFPRLENLRLWRVGRGADNHAVQHCYSNMINSIAFTWDDQEDADLNLQSLTLPELTSLEMRGNSWQVLRSWYQWPSWVSSTTAEFLTRSACSITSLSLVWLPITDQQTIDLLELMPTLTSLEIVERETNAPNVIITGKFTRRLVVDSQTSPFLPFLTKIMLAMQTKGLVEQDLLDVISSRWNPDPIQARESGVECLRSVGITVTGKHTGQDSLSSLARFKAEGLQLNVTRETPDFRGR
ncbi:hypothetical protein PM082_010412 [Marasmius tenuissimus]|nr:hypothetical protein PM082_010412 [Marasmius tenuissimus]